jgi:hypothetical protein
LEFEKKEQSTPSYLVAFVLLEKCFDTSGIGTDLEQALGVKCTVLGLQEVVHTVSEKRRDQLFGFATRALASEEVAHRRGAFAKTWCHCTR